MRALGVAVRKGIRTTDGARLRLEGKNAGAMLRLSEALEEHEDVQNVYSNFDIDEKELEALAQ